MEKLFFSLRQASHSYVIHTVSKCCSEQGKSLLSPLVEDVNKTWEVFAIIASLINHNMTNFHWKQNIWSLNPFSCNYIYETTTTQYMMDFSNMCLFVFLWCTSVEFYCLQIKGFSCYSDAFYLLAWQARLNHRWKKPRDILSAGKHIHIFIWIYILWSLRARFLICRCLCVVVRKDRISVFKKKMISNWFLNQIWELIPIT